MSPAIAVFLAHGATLAPPAGDAVEPWKAAAEIAGLTMGAPDARGGVTLERAGDHLRIRALDGGGVERILVVPWPDPDAERQDAVALGASLLRSLERPLRVPEVAPAATAPPPPQPSGVRRPAPDATRPPGVESARDGAPMLPGVATPRPSDVATAVPPDRPPPSAPASPEPPLVPEDVATAVPSDATPPPAPGSPEPALVPEDVATVVPAPRSAVRPWLRLGPAVAWRASTALSGSAAVEAGLRAGRSLRLGAHAAWDASRAVRAVGGDAVVDGASVGVGAWWSPDRLFVPHAGVTLGASYLRFLDGDTPVGALWRPSVGAEAGVAWSVTGRVALIAGARGDVDLGVTTVQDGEDAPVAFSPWEVGANVGLRIDLR